MAKLEVKERDYFANRYFGRDKAVLKGWKVDRKQKLFIKFIKDLWTTISARMGPNAFLHQNVIEAINACKYICDALQDMNNLWYQNRTAIPKNRLTTAPDFGDWEQIMNTQLDIIQTKLRSTMALPATQPQRQAYIITIISRIVSVTPRYVNASPVWLRVT
ncbi:unnamed protein product [Ectocarpus sp. 12 AP-2014]